MGRRAIDQKVRFLDHVFITETCWIWLGFECGGYGRFIRKEDDGSWKTENAHRSAFRIFKGPIPPGHIVRHTCDFTLCVNPDHLISGTHKDNSQDMVSRGRHRGNYKLTKEQVLLIRLDERENTVIAAELRVHPFHVAAIKGRRVWKKI